MKGAENAMVQQFRVDAGGVGLAVRAWGDARKPALVLVHGYPDNHSVWQPVAERLADRFYVLAYDVRGAGASDAPSRVRDYRMTCLAADLKAVVDALLPGRDFHLAAHDWGSIQSWESVTSGPLKPRILSYTSLSGPCLDHVGYWMRDRLRSMLPAQQAKVLRQLASSWYVGLFQIPLLPELVWQAAMGRLWPLYLSRVEGVTEPHPNPSQTQDGLRGVRLYRANFVPKLLRPEPRYAACPVLLIVPQRDNYVGTQLFEDMQRWVPELYRQDIDASHWVPLSHPDLIARSIGDFVSAVERGDQAEAWSPWRVSGAGAALLKRLAS